MNLFDPTSGVLQLGFQKPFHQRFSLSLDHGVKLRVLRWGVSEKKEHSYSKTKAELKYFFGVNSRPAWSRVFPYLSIEGMYFPQEYIREDNWVYRGGTYYRFDYSSVTRPVWVVSLKFGKETRYRKVVLDKFIGIGLRRLSIKHQAVGEREDFYDHDDWSVATSDLEEGIFYKIHLSLGVKFGYPFYR